MEIFFLLFIYFSPNRTSIRHNRHAQFTHSSFTVIIAVLLFKTAFYSETTCRLIVGFIGAIILISDGGNLLQVFSSESEISIVACGKVALATMFYGCSVNILKNKLVDVNSTTIAVIALAMVMPSP